MVKVNFIKAINYLININNNGLRILSCIITIILALFVTYYSNKSIDTRFNYDKELRKIEHDYLLSSDINKYNKELNMLLQYSKYINLYDKKSSSEYKYWYFPMLSFVAIMIDILSFTIDPLYYKDFMIISIIVFAILIVMFGCTLSYKSLRKLEKSSRNKLILADYSPIITIIFAYVSLIIIAFKAIPLPPSPYHIHIMAEIINIIPIIFVQFLFILSLIKVKNGIVFHCNQKIAYYKINKMYDKLLSKLKSQQNVINNLKDFKNKSKSFQLKLQKAKNIHKHLLYLVNNQLNDVSKLKRYIKKVL